MSSCFATRQGIGPPKREMKSMLTGSSLLPEVTSRCSRRRSQTFTETGTSSTDASAILSMVVSPSVKTNSRTRLMSGQA